MANGDPHRPLDRRPRPVNGLMVPRPRQTMTGANGMDRAMTDMTRGSVPKAPAVRPPGGNGLMRRPRPAPVTVDREGNAVPGVSGRLHTMLESDSPYIERARTRGTQHANRRGLLNSSIAAGASEAAAIDAALPIAQADASIAAGERAMRSQEFQQYRAIRSQELMQQKGLDHDEAQKQANRELQDLLQRRDHMVQQLMQTERLDHDAAMQKANRALQATLQRRAHAHSAGQAQLQRQFQSRENRRQRSFAETQAGLDRAQQLGMHSRTIESTERQARDAAVRDINSEYQRHITALSLNTNIPVEERRAMEDHYAFIRDQTMQAVEQSYGVDLEWSSSRRPDG